MTPQPDKRPTHIVRGPASPDTFCGVKKDWVKHVTSTDDGFHMWPDGPGHGRLCKVCLRMAEKQGSLGRKEVAV